MASINETGHAKNVANLQNLIAFIKGYGPTYNPSKNTLKIPQLETLLTDAQTKLAEVVSQNAVYNSKVNDRQNAFSGLKSLSTRIINALQTTDAIAQTIEDAKGFNRKLQGTKRKSESATPLDPDATAPNTISTSQQSYTQQIQHLAGLIAVLKNVPSYKPNETELQIATLEALQSELATKNNDVSTAFAALSSTRMVRNATFYTDSDSIFEVASDVKKYIKSIFGATSAEFAQVKGIEFKNPKP